MTNTAAWGLALRAGALACALVFLPTSARADVGVTFDCFLDDGPVECGALTPAFFESTPGVISQDSGDVMLKLRVNGLASALRFHAELRSGSASSFEVDRLIPRSVGVDVALARVVALMQQCVFPFLEVTEPAEVVDGELRLRAQVGDVQQVEPTTAWYVRPNIWGEVFSAGLVAANTGAGLDVNYSDELRRIRLRSGASYRYLDIDLGDEQLKGGFLSASGSLVAARSFGRFSLAALGDGRREVNNNLGYRLKAGVGAEWVRAPMLKTSGTNVGLRTRLFSVFDRYETETTNGRLSMSYPEGQLSSFVVVHLKTLDLSASVGARMPLTEPSFWDVGADFSLTLRPISAMEVRLGAGLVYRNAALHEPGDSEKLDRVARLTSGSDFGTLSYQARISLAYSFGNALLAAQDQRWR